MGQKIGPNGFCGAEFVGIFRGLLLECGDGAMRPHVHLPAYC